MKTRLKWQLLIIIWSLATGACLGSAILLSSTELAVGALVIACLPFLLNVSLFHRFWLITTVLLVLPVSVSVSIGGGGTIMVPSELLLILLIVSVLLFKKNTSLRALNHPLVLLLILELFVFFVCTLLSSMPSVSVKQLITHSLYVVGGTFIIGSAFVKIKKGWLLYFIASVGVIIAFVSYALFMMKYDWSSQVVSDAPKPFFSDHNIFGAYVAFMVPAPFWLALGKKWDPGEWWKPWLIICIGIVILIIAVLSFSRAVWLSLVVMLFFAVVLRLKIPFYAISTFAVIVLTVVAMNFNIITQKLTRNRASSGIENIGIQIKSISNISSDESNMERINRWKSAWQMFLEKPHHGFGPGTYTFQYAPYQRLEDKTRISTNFGDRGNAHSEWLMYLAETGWPGLLVFVSIVIVTFWRGFYIYRKTTDQNIRLTVAIALTCLAGYLAHGTVNSFMAVDKIALLFYGSMGLIIASDLHLYYRKDEDIA